MVLQLQRITSNLSMGSEAIVSRQGQIQKSRIPDASQVSSTQRHC